MNGPNDEHLPAKRLVRRFSPRALAVAGGAAALLLVGAVVMAASGDDPDPSAAPTTSTRLGGSTTATVSPSGSGSTAPATASSSSASTSTIVGTSSTPGTDPPALTTVPGTRVTAPPDNTPATTLPPPASTTPPAPSTTGPDGRTPTQAYAQEFERYCRTTFSIAPDGVLYDPDFVTDSYTVDDCLYWLDPEWGEFFDTPAEAATEGIADAISTIEDMSPLSSVLCWIDAATEQWGGCWYSPNL